MQERKKEGSILAHMRGFEFERFEGCSGLGENEMSGQDA